ncbi:MAG: type VI secretion system baseplate subunit TssF [Krumholzibacteria bacterium]|nr:type VI secretion system baseplate subunit TssF [Candidatus Krumholzibacteria bacterium]
MRDRLLHYYENELRFIRRQLVEFAESYPAIAGQLLLEPDKCEDPHVERLIEAFAMLTARVQLRLDDDFPEISTALLDLLQPNFLAPVPSLTVVQFTGDPDRSQATTGTHIPRHSQIHTPPVGGVRCRFRTCYPVTLWPIEVTGLGLIALDRGSPQCPPDAVAAVRIGLRTLGAQTFAQLPLESLRLFFDGNASTANRLYEQVFRQPRGVLVRPGCRDLDASRVGDGARFLPPEALRQVGFAVDEGLLDAPRTSHLGHRLLQEYFLFPDKFLFGDITGLTPALLAGVGKDLEILVLLDRLPLELEAKLGPENLKLGCTPAANLFPHQADPIQLSQTEPEHRVVPDVHAPRAYEVHSIRAVETLDARTGQVRAFRPFFALRHGDLREGELAFWHATRRPAGGKHDPGTEVYLTLVDPRGGPPAQLPGDTLVVHVLATNRDLPADLPLGTRGGEFRIEGQPGVDRVRTLRKPTAAVRGPARQETLWRLVSVLSLNHLSLLELADDGRSHHGGGPVAFRELLSLLDFADTPVTRQRIAGLAGLDWRRVLRLISTGEGRLLTRGLEITLHLDEAHYTGSSAFIFASVLERFLAYYTSINSFTQTVATVRKREEVLKRWQPRAGEGLIV